MCTNKTNEYLRCFMSQSFSCTDVLLHIFRRFNSLFKYLDVHVGHIHRNSHKNKALQLTTRTTF